jgi:glycosyltransferase involved in cell wall biosynthesis
LDLEIAMRAHLRIFTRAAAAGGTPSVRPQPESVLLVTDHFLPRIGGTEVTTLREAEALQVRGHAVRVLTLRHDPQWPSTEEIHGVPVRRIGGVFLRGRLRLRFGASWLVEARTWHELVRMRSCYDVVQVRHLGRLTRPAVLASFVTGKPLVVRIACASAPHGGKAGTSGTSDSSASRESAPPTTPKAYLRAREITPDFGDLDTLRRVQYLAPLTLRLLRTSRVTFLALSTRIRQHLIESGFAEDQIVLLPNGVDPATYQNAAAGRVFRPSSAPGDTLTVVCPARLTYQKGQDVLLQAWRTVQERVPAARLTLAGDGPESPQLERLAADLGISGTVQFAGLVTDMRKLLADAHVFVLPSRYEGMSNALLEAMAAGLPCVATRVSGSEDAIVDGQSGLLAPPEDPGALASALVALLTDRELSHALGHEARVRVIHAFAQKRVLDELSHLYSSLVRGGGTRRPRIRSSLTDSLRRASAAPAPTAVVEDGLGDYPTELTADNVLGQ